MNKVCATCKHAELIANEDELAKCVINPPTVNHKHFHANIKKGLVGYETIEQHLWLSTFYPVVQHDWRCSKWERATRINRATCHSNAAA